MKRNAVIFGLLMVSTFTFAQEKAMPTDRASSRAEKMKTELSLDDVQYKSIQAIHEEFVEKQKTLRTDSTLSKEEKHKQMRALYQQRQEAIGKVLNEEQKSKWATQSKSYTEKRIGMAKHRSEHSKRMQEDLKLTDDQTAKIKALEQEFGAKFRALRNDSTIARE